MDKSRIVEWRPDKKNGGSPLGSIYLDGSWDGYMGHGEALSYAKHHGAKLKITGPLAAYAKFGTGSMKDEIPPMIQAEKFIGTLVGCAIGDALGMPVESWPKARIRKHVGRITEMMGPVILRDANGGKLTEDEFGKIHHWTEVFEKGEYTDDTILTLAIAESIIERGLPDLHHITEKQLEIYQEFSQGRSKCGFGGTTKAAFDNLVNGALPTKSGVIGGPGTGPAMKMAPVGMWMALAGDFQTDDRGRTMAGLYFAKLIGTATHLDPRSIVCGVIQAAAIWVLLRGELPSTDREYFSKYLYGIAKAWEGPLTDKHKWYRKGDITSKLKWITKNSNVSVSQAHDHLGSSSATYQAYPFTLWMFQKFWDTKSPLNPIAGLEELVNCGGDCDTTGAMFGALVGAKHGMIFPEKWTSQVKNLDYVIEVGKKFAALRETKWD